MTRLSCLFAVCVAGWILAIVGTAAAVANQELRRDLQASTPPWVGPRVVVARIRPLRIWTPYHAAVTPEVHRLRRRR